MLDQNEGNRLSEGINQRTNGYHLLNEKNQKFIKSNSMPSELKQTHLHNANQINDTVINKTLT